MHEDDEDSLFGSPPPSPQFVTEELASICDDDDDRRLSTSTDTQNVGTIALPGSHYSELPLNPLALSLNHATVHRPPAHSQDQPTTLPDPSSEPPPARNQQINPSTNTHIRGTSLNPIVVDDEDTPIQNLFNPPPVKRRRLHCVPAGAADWDVPYPFKEGDGPDEYHKTWERKRSKEIVMQFFKLIKLAERNGTIKLEHPSPSPAPEQAPPQAAVPVPAPPPAPAVPVLAPPPTAVPIQATPPAAVVSPPTTVPVPAPAPTAVPIPAPPPTALPLPLPLPLPVLAPPAPRPKNTISQSRKEEILRRAREKRRQVQQELDRVKTQLWETTIEQAALVHLLKRYELLEKDQE